MPLYAIIKEQTHKVCPTTRTQSPYLWYKGEKVDYFKATSEETIEFVIDLCSISDAEDLANTIENHSDNLVEFPAAEDFYKLAYYSVKEISGGLKTLEDLTD